MAETRAQSSRPVSLRLSLRCSLQEVRLAALAAAEFLQEQGVDVARIKDCELALVEACNNAIDYATESGRSRSVEVDISCHEAMIEMRVNDHTPGFEWPARIELPEPEQENGRGLFLIQSAMDDVCYLRGPGSNCLILKKRLKDSERNARLAPSPASDQIKNKLNESEQIIGEMAEELSFCYESLSAIFRCSTELGRSNNLDEFSERLLTDLSRITSTDWFVLRLISKEETQLSVRTASEPALQLTPLIIAGIPAESGRPAELEAALTRQDVWFDHANPLASRDPLGRVKPRSFGLVHPIVFGGRLMGTLAVGKTSAGAQFTAVQANVVHTFADFLAIQIVNARFQEDQVNSRLVSRELEIAQNIQRSLLPTTLPSLPGYQLSGFCESARQVGGDFYDVLKFDDTSALLVIADVMGKGIPAAMFAAILRSLLRAGPEWINQPAVLLSRVNRLLFDELSGVDMFITAQLVFIDTAGQRLIAASAGHCPLLLAGNSDGRVKTVAPDGVPLGILPGASFCAQTEQFGPDARLLLYTDGVTEARSPNGEFFGQERLMRWFEGRLGNSLTAEELSRQLAVELNDFQANAAPTDDQTFLILA